MVLTRSNIANELIDHLAEELQVPESRYEQAEASYHAVSQWLGRPESKLSKYHPKFYSQGSFQLGTVIRPISDEDDYDVDAVCELSVDASAITQATLKKLVGYEIAEYMKRKNMTSPPHEGRRCWRIDYADGANFHLDILPARPDGQRLHETLIKASLNASFSNTAIAITDKEHEHFSNISFEWPFSNPKGYAEWFKSRMVVRFVESALRKGIKAHVEKIPAYRALTPLQSSIQILKRHRDIMFTNEAEHKPISIIITTLAAHAYQQEDNVPDALYSILFSMEDFIELKSGVSWIENPSDPRENFADKWVDYPEKKDNFFKWLKQARDDFSIAAEISESSVLLEKMSEKMGRNLIVKASARPHSLAKKNFTAKSIATISSYKRKLFNVAHRKTPAWPEQAAGRVDISVNVRQSGFRDKQVASDGKPLPKHCDLTFKARTNVVGPFRVYWQVVNTGDEARLARLLRGDFVEGIATRGDLTHSESTLYSGQHWIECFIVKDGKLVARSGEFIVNIA